VDEETGHFGPEYAEIYGVPFAFIPGDHQPPKGPHPRPAIEVRAVEDRWRLAVRFPKLDGYRVELPDQPLHANFDDKAALHLDQQTVALWVETRGVIGAAAQVDLDDIRHARPQRVAFEVAKALVEREEFFAAHDGVERPWLFPQLVNICRRWLDTCVTTDPAVTKGYLLLAQARARAAEKVFGSIVSYPENRSSVLLPVVRRFDPEGSTDNVRFVTRKVVMDPPPTKSHLNHVVLDGLRGNSWEEGLARILEHDDRVLSYVKNERLGFTIPYVHEGRSHDYVPDFLVRLITETDEVDRTLIVEVSGSQKSPGPTKAKANTARNQWCAAVNNDGRWGRWGYIEVHNPLQDWPDLDAAVDALYQDQPIIGLPV
jgi:type III restriction enzyme